MRALTIRQPWAHLAALGIKTIETRTRPAPAALIGQRIAIHAAVRPVDRGHLGEWLIDRNKRDGSWMRRGTLDASVRLPLGAVVGSAVLAASVPMVGNWQKPNTANLLCERGLLTLKGDPVRVFDGVAEFPMGVTVADVSDQLPFGDFAPGRWAWLLIDAAPVERRCPCCWGTGDHEEGWDPIAEEMIDPDLRLPCCLCNGDGWCAPISARGQLGLWRWEP